MSADLATVLDELDGLARDRLALYRPYPKQAEFHAGGARLRERLFLAGNQVGKTLAGAAELAMHLTGRYPAWWQGRRFDRPIAAWAAGVTAESTRDNPQRLLLGRPGAWGSGMIPAAAIRDIRAARNVAELIDTLRVRHASGGDSQLGFKFYEKGREKWQGETLDCVWCDEEPPDDIYGEGLTRTNATGGVVFVTATPLLGMTTLMGRFLGQQSPDRGVVTMTIDDARHYTAEERARIIAGYAAHEREARARGVPMLGSGRVFAVPEALIQVPAFEIPGHWPQLGGFDFGWDHPTAAVRLAWDREADRVFVVDAYRAREATPAVHAGALRQWGEWLPWAWPQDGLQHSKDSGEPLAAQYRRQGLAMTATHAQYPDGSVSVEAGLMDMLDRMQTDRLKVFAHLNDWFEEYRLYHRRDGKVVKENDDLLSATRYGVMMLRHARPRVRIVRTDQTAAYDPFAW